MSVNPSVRESSTVVVYGPSRMLRRSATRSIVSSAMTQWRCTHLIDKERKDRCPCEVAHYTRWLRGKKPQMEIIIDLQTDELVARIPFHKPKVGLRRLIAARESVLQ